MESILQSASGFAYCVSRTGVTGVQSSIESGAKDLLEEARKHTPLPLALGFGISTPEQAADAAKMADAVVVGSAIVQRFHDAEHSAQGRKAAAEWVGGLVEATKAKSENSGVLGERQ